MGDCWAEIRFGKAILHVNYEWDEGEKDTGHLPCVSNIYKIEWGGVDIYPLLCEINNDHIFSAIDDKVEEFHKGC